MGVERCFGDRHQIRHAERVGVVPVLLVVLVGTRDRDVVHRALLGLVCPNGGLDAPVTNRVYRPVCFLCAHELRYENDPGRKARGKLYDLKQQLARQTLDEIQHWLTRHGTVSDRVKMLSLHVGRNIDFFLDEADSQHWWVIDDWIDGPSLEDVLLRGPMERAHALHVMFEVAEVLQVLHAEGLVYRALDPRSIFLTRAGTVVTNFELTKIMGAVKSVHPTAQWPNWTVFVAPEVKGRGKVEPSVDLFSWGMILSYALTGKMPTGPDPAKLVIAASGLPKKIIDFAVRCCDQKKRPTTFDPIARFLEENASRRGASRGP